MKTRAAIALGLVCAAGCRPTASPSSRAHAAPVRAPQPSRPPSSVSPSESAAPPPVVSPAKSAAPPAKPGPTIACGNASCSVGSEVCCKYASTYWCARLTSPKRDRRTLERICTPPPGVHAESGSDIEYATCDDSDDCSSSERCCSTGGIYDNPYVSVCTPKGDECDAELCRAGTCRGRLRSCQSAPGLRDRCVSGAHLGCGGAVCSGRKWVCRTTANDAHCSTLESTQGGVAWQCIRPGDCPHGTRCCVSLSGAACGRECDYGAGTNACNTDADCPPIVIMGQRKQRHCVALEKAMPGAAPPGFTKVCDFR